MLSKERKSEVIKRFARTENDTGSSEAQIGILSERIVQIAAHLKLFPKDKHSRFGLVKIVGKRRSLLNYLKKNNKEKFNFVQGFLKKK